MCQLNHFDNLTSKVKIEDDLQDTQEFELKNPKVNDAKLIDSYTVDLKLALPPTKIEDIKESKPAEVKVFLPKEVIHDKKIDPEAQKKEENKEKQLEDDTVTLKSIDSKVSKLMR